MTSIIIQFSFLFLNLTRIGSNYNIRISFPYYSNGNKIWEESDWKYLVEGAEGLFFFVPQKDEWEACWYILPQKIDRQWDWHHQKILCEVKSIKSRLRFIFDSYYSNSVRWQDFAVTINFIGGRRIPEAAESYNDPIQINFYRLSLCWQYQNNNSDKWILEISKKPQSQSHNPRIQYK